MRMHMQMGTSRAPARAQTRMDMAVPYTGTIIFMTGMTMATHILRLRMRTCSTMLQAMDIRRRQLRGLQSLVHPVSALLIPTARVAVVIPMPARLLRWLLHHLRLRRVEALHSLRALPPMPLRVSAAQVLLAAASRSVCRRSRLGRMRRVASGSLHRPSNRRFDAAGAAQQG